MKNLEEIIQERAARGELSHLSLVASFAPRGNGVKWRAVFRGASAGIHGEHAEADDPVEALREAITTAPKRRVVEQQPADDPDDFG